MSGLREAILEGERKGAWRCTCSEMQDYTCFFHRALKEEAQLTAQLEGVPCMGECGQEAWAIHYKEAVKQALEEMKDREFSGAKRTLEEALKHTTPAASTPPEWKVREELERRIEVLTQRLKLEAQMWWDCQSAHDMSREDYVAWVLRWPKTVACGPAPQALAAPAPACKTEGGSKKVLCTLHSFASEFGGCDDCKPCPDCNAGES